MENRVFDASPGVNAVPTRDTATLLAERFEREILTSPLNASRPIFAHGTPGMLGSSGSNFGNISCFDRGEHAFERAEKRPVYKEPHNFAEYVALVRSYRNYKAGYGKSPLFACMDGRAKELIVGEPTSHISDDTVLFADGGAGMDDHAVLQSLKSRMYEGMDADLLCKELTKFLNTYQGNKNTGDLDIMLGDAKIAISAIKERLLIYGKIPSTIARMVAGSLKPELLGTYVSRNMGDCWDHDELMKRLVELAKKWLIINQNVALCVKETEKSTSWKKTDNSATSRPDSRQGKSYDKKRVLAATTEDSGKANKKTNVNEGRCYGCGNVTKPFHRKSECPCRDMDGFNEERSDPPVPPLKLPSDSKYKVVTKKK
jgi:hypothetical protein